MSQPPLIFAVPKGRILSELRPIFKQLGLEPEPDFENEKSRKLLFDTNDTEIKIIRVRSFDVATFVAFGAAQLGVAGNDVLMEFDYSEIYAPLDLNIGHCRLSLCQKQDRPAVDTRKLSHLRVATKFPRCTRHYFADKGVQAECIALNGAMELAPLLDLAPFMVDLVATGSTLKANKLVEIEKILDITARLIVNRATYKTQTKRIQPWIERFRAAVPHQNASSG